MGCGENGRGPSQSVSGSRKKDPQMKLWFTIDMEDWYQGIGLPPESWPQYEKRIRIGHDKLLNLLSKHNVKATYFILGKVVEEFPELIQQVKDEGHELACHTYSHPFLYQINKEQFRAELQKCKELISSFQNGYNGFRAPYFSIDTRNLWAIDVLKEEGFSYDSSIFPGSTARTGIAGFKKEVHTLENGLKEFPISNFKVLQLPLLRRGLGRGLDFGAGGAYFRILPYSYFRKKLGEILKARPAVFYIHPWELDPDHPYLKGLGRRIQYTHYFNLKNTEKKLDKLLSDFEFCSPNEIFN
jgi:polysaccharide deacetylase family protein (PEP-CTERM system associated)